MRLCCFGLSLQNASIFIAIIDIVGGLFGVITTVLFSVLTIFYPEKLEEWIEMHVNATETEELKNATMKAYEELNTFLDQPFGLQLGVLIFLVVLCLLELGLAMLLLKGAKSRLIGQCNLWIKIKGTLLLVVVLFCVGAVIISEDRLPLAISSVIAIFYQIYCILVVRSFADEIKFGSYRRANCGDPPENEEEMNKL